MYYYDNSTFNFQYVSQSHAIYKTGIVSPKNYTQEYSIRDKLIKENKILVSFFIYDNFKNVLSNSMFLTVFNMHILDQ